MSIGIWQIVIIAVILGAPAVVIWSERTDLTTGRLNFLLWLFLLFGTPNLVGVLGGFFGTSQDTIFIVGLIYVLILFVPFFRKLVQRARDAGMPKSVCYVTIIPLLNLFVFLALLFWPPKERSIDSSAPGPKDFVA